MRRLSILLALAALAPGLAAQAGAQEPPSAALPFDLSRVQLYELPRVDLRKARVADQKRQFDGEVAHFAAAVEVGVSPLDRRYGAGYWSLDSSRSNAYWRVRIRSRGALSLSLAFTRFRLPEDASLTVYSADGGELVGPFTARDNDAHGELWTPPLLGDDVIVELKLPRSVIEEGLPFDLEIGRVHHGYAGFGETRPLSGPCERDVACAQSPIWYDAARSVGLVVIDGVRYCSGFMINNTALDGRPFFVTAHHCGVTRENASSVVVMWNYESASCRQDGAEAPGLAPSRHFQTGAVLRAAFAPTDVVLLELDDLPRPDWNVHYAGWDRTPAKPRGTAAIHHPNTDLKRLSLDLDPIATTYYLHDDEVLDGDHFRIGAWELGTTEGGSSGAPLFNRDQRVIGQLHGGYASCGDRAADWFGRFAVSWSGGGRPGQRFSDWLDSLNTDSLTLDGLDAGELLGPDAEP